MHGPTRIFWANLLVTPHRDGSEVGPTLDFYGCVPTRTHGPTRIFWANPTPFSLGHGGGPRGVLVGGVHGGAVLRLAQGRGRRRLVLVCR
jgi:hypothetical protein